MTIQRPITNLKGFSQVLKITIKYIVIYDTFFILYVAANVSTCGFFFTTPNLAQGMMKLSAKNLLRSIKVFAKICNNQHDVLIRRQNETLMN